MYAHSPPPPITHLFRLVARRLALAAGIVAPALAIGIGGYHAWEGWSFLDSLLNASMILSGMGPVSIPSTVGGKLFASFYALFSGLVFLTVAALVFAPVMHRILHRFHFEMGQDPRSAPESTSR
jgi:TRAP-type C4-dicarboxylate transport system permease small subunit